MLYDRLCYIVCYIACFIADPYPHTVHLAGSPRDARAQTPAVSLPSSSYEISEAPDERDLDWEVYDLDWEELGLMLIKLQS